MEQKRTLWILIAAGVFLCVVIGAAFLFFGNSQKNNSSAMSMKGSESMWVVPEDKPLTNSSYGYTDDQPVAAQETALASTPSSLMAGNSTPVEASPNSITHADSVTVISQGSTNVYEIPGGASAVQDGTTTIDLNSLKEGVSSGSSVKAQNQVAADAIEQTKQTKASKAAPKVLESNTKKSTASAKNTASGSKTAKKSSGSTKTVLSSPSPDRYWVQVGAFVNKKNADEARSVLEAKSIKCEVFTYEDAGVLKYRLRAGDYTSRTEAEYWQKQIDKLDYFARNSGGTMIVHTGSSLAKK